MYTDSDILELFKCEKRVVDPPSREYKEERGHLKKAFSLLSLDGRFMFNAFIRCNIHFSENFTVGLDFNPREAKGTICLFRCNGAHGENRMLPHHSSCHIHRASAESINSGLKPESNITPTEEYSTLDEAIQFFVKEINLSNEDRRDYFPTPDTQATLNFENE